MFHHGRDELSPHQEAEIISQSTSPAFYPKHIQGLEVAGYLRFASWQVRNCCLPFMDTAICA